MKGLFTLLVIGGLIYGIYSGFMAVWSYFEVSNLVEEVVPRELPKISERAGWRAPDRVKKIHDVIVDGATQAGIPLDPEAVVVTEEGGALWVRINAAYPMIRYKNEYLLNIPISTAHSFSVSQ